MFLPPFAGACFFTCGEGGLPAYLYATPLPPSLRLRVSVVLPVPVESKRPACFLHMHSSSTQPPPLPPPYCVHIQYVFHPVHRREVCQDCRVTHMHIHVHSMHDKKICSRFVCGGTAGPRRAGGLRVLRQATIEFAPPPSPRPAHPVSPSSFPFFSQPLGFPTSGCWRMIPWRSSMMPAKPRLPGSTTRSSSSRSTESVS